MQRFPCPFCGLRDEPEFRFDGGSYQGIRVAHWPFDQRCGISLSGAEIFGSVRQSFLHAVNSETEAFSLV